MKKFSLPGPRGLAFDCVTRSLDGGADAQAVLDDALSSSDLDQRDRGFVTEILYGYLRMRIRLQTVLNCFLSNPDGLPAPVLRVLGMASYEIMHMDVPAYASVDWGVDSAKRLSRGKLGGLANAVLRKVARLAEDGADEDFFRRQTQGDVEYLSAYYSCPEWIVELWLDSYGREKAEMYLDAQICPPAAGFVLNTKDKEARKAALTLMEENDFIESDGQAFAFYSGYRPQVFKELPKEVFARQSYAAREALSVLEPVKWAVPVWDACAGRGGKLRFLNSKGVSPIIASDPHLRRLSALKRETPSISAFRASAINPPLAYSSIGTALLDVPCSGLGVLSRRPDTKFKRTPDDVASLIRLQSKILENSWKTVRSGGRMAYITCTLNPAENEVQIASFLKKHKDAKLVKEWTTPPESELREFFYSALIEKN
ncbi:transcription antitermination factor NusB [Maridesulfovibrio hydrothermalis]|uniref:NusB/RsmB/TIM44 n=1 Tax=Maridesulfovibrio hydrothermalis AM13 = DSM 14728 TaxID=1121451 RepID=L0R9G6_9BACT|nr:transcription antitermination factor NusB [Maridesulfovibrio hydrothermalis]CCO22857.1 NusB/RsmB/TIM44 [Maridesulfovibrio hydrothermalis AM13 = DSM 14728]